ncbi:hypothetical protein GCM10027049_07680 [Mucilaginibacter puniceus]
MKWDKNYTLVDIDDILKFEHMYADSVEKHKRIASYYFRRDGYRFKATFLGEIKPINKDVINSIKRIFKLTGTEPDLIDQICNTAVLMKAGNEQIWMPIQTQILEAFKEEVVKGNEITLYCLYLNEHTSKNVLYNNFVISEFIKE